MLIPQKELRCMRHRLQQQQQDATALLFSLHQQRFWVHPWITRCLELGQYYTLMAELEWEHCGDFVNYLRMDPAMFHDLLQCMTPRLTKMDTNCHAALEPDLKLAITLRYLASGYTFNGLSFAFRVPHNTISLFVGEVLRAIIDTYGDKVVAVPDNADDWRSLSAKFVNRWNFHHACGAIEGKHIAIKASDRSGTVYHNYKGMFSIMLLGLVDAEYKFIWIDVGTNGSTSECVIFNSSDLLQVIEGDTLGLPPHEPLPGDDRAIPYFFIGDVEFDL